MNKELLKEGLKKYWVLPLILTILLVLMVPIYTLLQKVEIVDSASSFKQIDEVASNLETPIDLNMEQAYSILATDTYIYSYYPMLIILILPIVLGVQLFGNERKSKNKLTDFIKENNLSKGAVYKTNIVTGALFSIAPFVIASIILVVIKLFAGMGDYITTKTILNWTCISVFSSLLFFVITVLVGFITKSKSLQVLYTYGLLFIPVFVIYLFEIFLTKVVYGFPGFGSWFIDLLNQVPAIKICQLFTTQFINYSFANTTSLWYILVYAIISALIVWGGYKLVNIKNQEKLQKVGDEIFKYIWIFIVGAFLYIVLMLAINNPIISIFITVLSILLVYIIKELIFKRDLKVIFYGKKYYIISLVSVLFVVLFSTGLFGYENKIPDKNEVEYMTYTVAYPSEIEDIEFREEENISNLIEKHKTFISNQNSKEHLQVEDIITVYLKYKLKNGNTLIRGYETTLSMDDPIFLSEEYVKQKYAYMYDKTENVDIIKLAGMYNNKTFTLEANRYENLDLVNELISYIANDLSNYKVHMPKENEYKAYSDKEGMQILQIGILDGMNQYTNYLYYLKIDDTYELIKKLQTLIDEENELITWQDVVEE